MKRIPLKLDRIWGDYNNKRRGIEICSHSMCANFELDEWDLPSRINLYIDREEHDESMRVDWTANNGFATYDKRNRRVRSHPYVLLSTRQALRDLGYSEGDTFYISVEVVE